MLALAVALSRAFSAEQQAGQPCVITLAEGSVPG
jgi:hypothetical protein